MVEKKKEKIRIDKYLWSIRIFKTRTQAADACEKGKIKTKGENVKASATVKPGDEYEIKTEARKWKIKVVSLIEQRVQYAEAIKHYEDITPPEWIEVAAEQASSFHTGKRLSKIGRPTKKQRRELDDFME